MGKVRKELIVSQPFLKKTPIHGEMVEPAKLSNGPQAKRHGRIPSQAHELKNKPGEKFTDIQKHPDDA